MNKKTDEDARREIEKIKSKLNKDSQKKSSSSLTGFKTKSINSSAVEKLIGVLTSTFGGVSSWIASTTKNLSRNLKQIELPRNLASLKSATDKLKSIPNINWNKKNSIVGGVIAAILVTGIFSIIKFDLVKVSQGIETSRGPADSKTFLVGKTDKFEVNDLVVAQLPGTTGDENLLVASIFSQNTEFYALYDGEVIWQVAKDSLLGKVYFAEATQLP